MAFCVCLLLPEGKVSPDLTFISIHVDIFSEAPHFFCLDPLSHPCDFKLGGCLVGPVPTSGQGQQLDRGIERRLSNSGSDLYLIWLGPVSFVMVSPSLLTTSHCV